MATNENLIPIPGRLHSVATEGHVAGADEIYDDTQAKDQETINSELIQAVGTGGSVDSRIAAAKAEIIGDAATGYNTLGKLEDKIQAEATRAEEAEEALDGRVDTLEEAVGTGGSVDSRISAAVATETTRAQGAESTLQNNISAEATARVNAVSAETSRAQAAEEQLRTLYNNLQQSQPIPVTSLPATGEAGKIYRLAGTTSYADYMYAEGALNTPIKMAEYDNAIDDEPTAASDNLVRSGGVFNSDLKAEGFAETSYSWSTGEHSSKNNQVTVNIQSGCEFLINLVNIGACGVFAYRSDGTYTELGECVGFAKFTAPYDIANIGIYHGNVSSTPITVGYKVVYNKSALYIDDKIKDIDDKIKDMTRDMPIPNDDGFVKGGGISSMLFNNYIIGKGTTLVETPLVGIIPNHIYRVWLKQLTWNAPSPGYDGATAFGIQYYPSGSSSPTIIKSIFVENIATNAIEYLDFVCPSSYDKFSVIGRAEQNTIVRFYLEDITYLYNIDKLVNEKVSFNGVNSSSLYSVLLAMDFKAGVKYKIQIKSNNLTWMGTAEQEAILQLILKGKNQGENLMLINLDKKYNGKSIDITIDVTPNFDCSLYKADRISRSDTVYVYRYAIPSLESKDIESVFSVRTLEQREKVSQLGYVRRFWYTEPVGDMTPPDWIPTLTMLHISDTHIGNETTDAQLVHAVELLNTHGINGKNNGDNIKCLLHTGDVRNSNFNDTAGWEKFTAAIAKANRPVFVVAGNHDVGNGYNVAESGTDEQIFTQMVAPFLSSWNLVTESPNTGTPNPTGKCYYFKDFIEEKIRMICLYEYETDFELNPSDNTKLKYQRGIRAFSQEQIDWLIDSLIKTPAGYGVLIATHQQENFQGNTDCAFNSLVFRGQNIVQTFCGNNIIADIIRAFINKTTINTQVIQTGGIVTTLNVSADFSDLDSNVEFIAYISGHNHQDRVSFLRDYPEQLELNIGCDNTWYTVCSDLWQRQGKLSEDLINAYNINRNAGTITIVRVGADFAYTGQVRQVATLQYR